MTRPSLTPHEDAFRRGMAQRGQPEDQFQADLIECLEMTNLKMARMMDAGEGKEGCLTFCISLCASIISSLAFTATATKDGMDHKAAQALIAAILMRVLMLTKQQPVSISEEVVHAPTETGTA